MAYTITKIADGDISLGSINGELVQLKPAVSDYPTSGYPIISQEQVVNNSALKANCDLWRILGAAPFGGQSGLAPVWNPLTNKMQMFWNASNNPPAGGPNQEVPNGTDLSSYTFNLLIAGL